MLKQIEGSRAMAEAIALCRPEVICAYPITPQTHIVEGLGEMVRTGELEQLRVHQRRVGVRRAFGRDRRIGGGRAQPTRRPQAKASCSWRRPSTTPPGLGLPIVMTLGNRAIGAPINIWNDHSDAMSMRDAGWMQLFAETNQEAVDLHIQAFRLAEELSMPVMVCVDGFILTHAVERIDIPDQADVDAYLPPYEPVQVLDPQRSRSRSAPWSAPRRSPRSATCSTTSRTLALRLHPASSPLNSRRVSGAIPAGCCAATAPTTPRLLVVAMGSVNGTIKDTIDEMRADGIRIGLVTLVSFRPFPTRGTARGAGARQARRRDREELRRRHGRPARQQRRSRAAQHRRRAASALGRSRGWADVPITRQSLHGLFRRALRAAVGRRAFSRSQRGDRGRRNSHHVRKVRRSGPTAENLLRRLSEGAHRPGRRVGRMR